MSTLRKSPHLSDGLSGVRYTPASAEEDPEDNCSDTGKLAFLSSLPGPPVHGVDVAYSARTMSSSTAPTSPPVSATLNGTYPYYDFQDTDENESEGGGGGCDSGDLCSPSHRLPNGNPLLPNHSSSSHNNSNHNHTHHNNHHHSALSEKASVDSTGGQLGRHHRHNELRDSRDLSKSPMSRRSRPGSKGRCMCCMMCVFLLSTAGLGAVLALTYAGKVQLVPATPRHTSHSNGGFKIDRLGDEKVVVQVRLGLMYTDTGSFCSFLDSALSLSFILITVHNHHHHHHCHPHPHHPHYHHPLHPHYHHPHHDHHHLLHTIILILIPSSSSSPSPSSSYHHPHPHTIILILTIIVAISMFRSCQRWTERLCRSRLFFEESQPDFSWEIP